METPRSLSSSRVRLVVEHSDAEPETMIQRGVSPAIRNKHQIPSVLCAAEEVLLIDAGPVKEMVRGNSAPRRQIRWSPSTAPFLGAPTRTILSHQ